MRHQNHGDALALPDALELLHNIAVGALSLLVGHADLGDGELFAFANLEKLIGCLVGVGHLDGWLRLAVIGFNEAAADYVERLEQALQGAP